MVDRITKALRKLSDRESRTVEKLLKKIKAGDVAALDVKKLKGSVSIYRLHKGSVRIMYQVSKAGKIKIIAIERRSSTTYKKL